MASIDEELLMDAEETRREIAYIREQLPSDLKEQFSDEQLQWVLEAIGYYFYSTDLFGADDSEVDIDMEEVSAHVCDLLREEHQFTAEPKDIFFIVEADLDFQEQEA